MIDLGKVAIDDFLPRQGEEFLLHPELDPLLETVTLVLAKVTDLTLEHMTYKNRTPFSLLFSGPEGLYLPQRIYRLENDAMGSMELFLVSMQPDERGALFESVFT